MALAVAVGGASWLGAGQLLARPEPEGAKVTRRAPPVAPPGSPIAGLEATELDRFARGRRAFEETRDVASGLGPLFNDSSCHRCHNQKGVGGAGIQSARVIGKLSSGVFDPLLSRGGPLLATASVTLEASARELLPGCRLPRDGEAPPPEANISARRRTTPLFGLGLVDATPDAAFEALARAQPAAIRGRVARVVVLATGELGVGKFGWKAQAPTLHQFSGLALHGELGVTNPEFPVEQAPHGDTAALAACDLVPDPEDTGEAVKQLTDFVQMLAPIDALARSSEARAGDALFTRIGCDGCHVRRLETGASAIAALSRREYEPYSDFLLHDMGTLGDGVAEGDAGPREMRTAPLWGGHLTGSRRLLHDGRARSLEEAIVEHDGQGAASRDLFRALSAQDRARLLAFLATL